MKKIPISDPEAEFDLLIAYLTETGKLFIDRTAKVAGFLLLAIGWIATSKDARDYLGLTPDISYLAAAAVIIACALSSVASWIAYRTTEQTFRNLVNLAYLPESAYAARRLRFSTFLICVLGNGALGALLATALILIP